MLDIIWSNIFLDIVQPLGGVDFKLESVIRNLMDLNIKSIASTFDRNKTANTRAFEKVIKAYEDMQ